MQGHASRSIGIPGCVDCLQGILSVIPLQLLAFHVAVLRGFDVSYRKTFDKPTGTLVGFETLHGGVGV